MAESVKPFDIAVLIDSNEQYKSVLHDGIAYHMKSRDLHFGTSQKYVKGDINIVQQSCNFVQEIDTDRYINGFFKNSNDITNSFKNIIKVRLFIFKENCSNIWFRYIHKQKNLPSDVVIIVNNKNQPIYMLHDAYVNILQESIKFKSHTPYQANDIKILNSYGIKHKTFQMNNKWKISINKKGKQLKNGICYSFASKQAKHAFFNCYYDVALITNDKNQMSLVLSDCIYTRNDNILSFKSHIAYKNGMYNKLKQCGELMKSLQIKEYRLENTKKAYKFGDVIANKCLLYNIKDIDTWVEYMGTQTNTFYDVGVITNTDEQQIYFLNKVHIDLTEHTINFGSCEEFAAKHHGLVNKFGRFIKKSSLKQFNIEKLTNGASDKGILNNINCYQWDLNKPQTNDSSNVIGNYKENEPPIHTKNTRKKSTKKVKKQADKKGKVKSKSKNKNKKKVNKNKKIMAKNKKTIIITKKIKNKSKLSKKQSNKPNKTFNKRDKYVNVKNKKVQKVKKVQNTNNTVKRNNSNKNTPKLKSKTSSKKKEIKKVKGNKKKVQKNKKRSSKTRQKKSKKKKEKKGKKDSENEQDKKDKKEKRRDSLLQPSILKKLERRNSRRNSKSSMTSLPSMDIIMDEPIRTNETNANPMHTNPIMKSLSINNYNANNTLSEDTQKMKEGSIHSINTPVKPPQHNVSETPKVAVIMPQKPQTVQVNDTQKLHTTCSIPKAPISAHDESNNNNSDEVINDREAIWNAYITKYGFEPKNAYQLQNFSKRNEHVRNLSYKEVRNLFKGRSK